MREITYNELFLIERDIQRIRKESPALAFFYHDKFERFLKLNTIRINTLQKRLGDLQRKYIEHDDQGNPISLENNQWKFRESFLHASGQTIIGSDEAKRGYYEECERFLCISFPVHL